MHRFYCLNWKNTYLLAYYSLECNEYAVVAAAAADGYSSIDTAVE